MQLVQYIYFKRHRGTETIPKKISQFNNFDLVNQNTMDISKPFVWFFRDPTQLLKKIKLTDIKKIKENGSIIYSKPLHQINNPKLDLLKDNIVSNGFYHSKYYNMRYLPRYFYDSDIGKSEPQIDKSYCFYNREECPKDKIELDKFIKNSNLDIKDILVLGKDTFNTSDLNKNMTYLVNNCIDDAVPNTLLEAMYAGLDIKLLNNLQVASGTKELLEGKNFSDFYKKLDKLNEIVWKEQDRVFVDKLFYRSKTFTDFLKGI